MKPGRSSRGQRLTSYMQGAWGTHSQDYMRLAPILFQASAGYAKRDKEQNVSPYPIAGVPLLLSALRAVLIECNSGVFDMNEDKLVMQRFASEPNELGILRDRYQVTGDLYDQLELMYEVRNEIVHPALRPAGTTDMTPHYLRPLKERGVLETSGDPSGDYPWFHQLQSHRLFRYAFELLEQIVQIVLPQHCPSPEMCSGYLATYSAFRAYDL
jgi:hypothetical protein